MTTPEIHILNLLIQEPTTFLTDLVLGVAGLRFAWSVRDEAASSPVQVWWTGFFALIGVSTLAGAVAHGFGYAVGTPARAVSWLTSGLAIFCAEEASIQVVERRRIRTWLQGFAWSQMLIFIAALLTYRVFLVVTINTTIGLLGLVAVLHALRYRATEDPGSWHIVAGILVAGITPVIHILKLSPHPWFNHNDLSHVILFASLYLIMLGARGSKATSMHLLDSADGVGEVPLTRDTTE